tara:strand:- start:590 stop:838 length:249 start_codon:yes stop_codon:yes gene_type:complete
MRNLLVIFALGLLLTGCKKEERDYKYNSNCGLITKVTSSGSDYIIHVENNLSGNIKTDTIEGSQFKEWNHGVGQGQCFKSAW